MKCSSRKPFKVLYVYLTCAIILDHSNCHYRNCDSKVEHPRSSNLGFKFQTLDVVFQNGWHCHKPPKSKIIVNFNTQQTQISRCCKYWGPNQVSDLNLDLKYHNQALIL